MKILFIAVFDDGGKSTNNAQAESFLNLGVDLIKYNYRIEEEKMAVMLMEMVGQNYNGRYYPSFSGTAQSFNFYPVSYMKRDEGVVHLALGLGRTIANGEKSLRFSPKYPGILP